MQCNCRNATGKHGHAHTNTGMHGTDMNGTARHVQSRTMHRHGLTSHDMGESERIRNTMPWPATKEGNTTNGHGLYGTQDQRPDQFWTAEREVCVKFFPASTNTKFLFFLHQVSVRCLFSYSLLLVWFYISHICLLRFSFLLFRHGMLCRSLYFRCRGIVMV